ncbi:hypothetical protein JCM10450v2_004519 [Rhodotorula kratochvilovae]
MARRVSYIHSDALVHSVNRLPSNLGRASLVHTLNAALDLVATDEDPARDHGHEQRAQVVEPREATRDELLRFHDPRYIDAILGTEDGEISASSDEDDISSSLSSPPRTFGLSSHSDEPPRKRKKVDTLGLHDDCPVFDELPAYVKLVAGASMTAARELRDGRADVAINWTGGRHHGKRGEAAGFCYVNDIVLAIMELRSAPQRAPSPSPPSSPSSPSATPPPIPPLPPRISRVLYLDLDLHHGDGVESAFLASPYVLTLSVHLHAPLFYPSTGALSSTGPPEPAAKGAHHALNVPLEPGAGGETLARVWGSCVERTKEAYDPDAVVLQLGTDGLAGDPCKEWNLPLSALGFALDRVLGWGKRTLLLGGGGYHSANAARAWAYLTSIALARPLPLDTPIPPDLPSAAYAAFGPDWTLDVPSLYGVRDRNTEATLGRVERAFEGYEGKVRERWEGKGKGKGTQEGRNTAQREGAEAGGGEAGRGGGEDGAPDA